MKSTPTIVLTGGGSGGHITPLLPLARELKKLYPEAELVYIGHKGDKVDAVFKSANGFDKNYKINGGKFRRYHGESLLAHLLDIKTLLLNARDFFRFTGAIFTSLRLIWKIKPSVVFSKGGFVAVPVCLAAKLFRVPIVTHDSDAASGLANRIIGRWADIHTTGMPKQFYNYPPQATFFVGVPVPDEVKKVGQNELHEFRRRLNLSETGLTVLVTGGGNGSVKLNNLMLASAPKLLSSFNNLSILHITGLSHLEDVRRSYKQSLSADQSSRVRVEGFVDNLHVYSGASDLIITRAGASSLAEFAVQAKACVVIPSPFLAAGHQLKNAQQLQDQKAAMILSESVPDGEFESVVTELLNSPAKRSELAQHLSALAKTDATVALAKIILALANGEKLVDAA